MEIIGEIKQIIFDEENSKEEYIVIDFELHGLPYFATLIRDDGLWKAEKSHHYWKNGSYCAICQEKVEEFGPCKKLSTSKSFSKKLLNHPTIRLKALLRGIVLD